MATDVPGELESNETHVMGGGHMAETVGAY